VPGCVAGGAAAAEASGGGGRQYDPQWGDAAADTLRGRADNRWAALSPLALRLRMPYIPHQNALALALAGCRRAVRRRLDVPICLSRLAVGARLAGAALQRRWRETRGDLAAQWQLLASVEPASRCRGVLMIMIRAEAVTGIALCLPGPWRLPAHARLCMYVHVYVCVRERERARERVRERESARERERVCVCERESARARETQRERERERESVCGCVCVCVCVCGGRHVPYERVRGVGFPLGGPLWV
jgi:hypothetical protein